MLKAGIFLDVENLNRNGGWGLRYEVIKELAEVQGTTVLRANAYLAMDSEREKIDQAYRDRNESYRAAIRRTGFHLVLKQVKKYYDSEGELVVKANADLDLAVDALLQSENLDYILLGSGDGDFLKLVRALQTRGKRVDLISFANTSSELKIEVDNYFSGFLVPGILKDSNAQKFRGILHAFNEERGFGFLTMRTGLKPSDIIDNIFCHVNQFNLEGRQADNSYISELKSKRAIIEFDLVESKDGLKAVNISEFKWNKNLTQILC